MAAQQVPSFVATSPLGRPAHAAPTRGLQRVAGDGDLRRLVARWHAAAPDVAFPYDDLMATALRRPAAQRGRAVAAVTAALLAEFPGGARQAGYPPVARWVDGARRGGWLLVGRAGDACRRYVRPDGATMEKRGCLWRTWTVVKAGWTDVVEVLNASAYAETLVVRTRAGLEIRGRDHAGGLGVAVAGAAQLCRSHARCQVSDRGDAVLFTPPAAGSPTRWVAYLRGAEGWRPFTHGWGDA